MNQKQILECLKSIRPSAKLPSQITFEVLEGCLFLKLSGKGVVANMQEDKSAFEGWSIVLKAALSNIENVTLDWESPVFTNGKENAQKAHYNRFLMRVANFKQAYAWFNIAESHINEVENMQTLLDSKSIVITYPSKECGPITDAKKQQEAILERKLVELWKKDCLITDEQLPIGLFNGIKSRETALTPERKSQIDLWQLDKSTMRIYEVKVKGNESIGIISELMFYVCTIKNIVDGRITYPDVSKVKSYRHFADFADAVAKRKIDNIIGYFTAPNMHPLLESPKLKDTIAEILNDNRFGVKFEFKNISHLTE